MSARQIVVPGAMPARDANGRALPSKFRFYLPSSGGVPATVFTDNTLTVPHDFPILSDMAGRWPEIWAEETLSFDVGWTDQVFDLTIRTFTNISPAADAVLMSGELAASSADAAEAAAAIAAAADADATAQATAAAASADQAAAYAAGGAPFTATSASSLTIGTSSQTFVLDQFGKLFSLGQTVVIAESSAPATQQMTGVVTSAPDPDTRSMTVLVSSFIGSGGHTDWTISLSASVSSSVGPSRQILTTGLATGGGDLSADRTINVAGANAGGVLAGSSATAAITPQSLNQAHAFFPLTDGATVAWDTGNGFNAKVTLGGNRLIAAPTNLKDGWTYTLDVSQDATGSRVPSFDTIWDWGLASAPTFSIGANKKDKIVAQYSAASGKLEANFRKSA